MKNKAKNILLIAIFSVFLFYNKPGLSSISSLFLSPSEKETIVFLGEDNSKDQEILILRQTIESLENEINILKNSERDTTPEEIIEETDTKKTEETVKTIEKIDINNATKEELLMITGIGPVKAEEIISLRPFSSLDDLLRVPGIGIITIENIIEEGVGYITEIIIEEKTKTIKETEKTEEIYDPCILGVEINESPKEDLLYITGVGSVTAENIINYREEESFIYIDDLLNVSGIGPVTLEKIKSQGCAYLKKKPILFLDKEVMVFNEINSQILTIINDGEVEMNYRIEADDWIDVNYLSGTINPKDRLIVEVSPLSKENKVGSFSVITENKTKEVEVSLKLNKPTELLISKIKINEREFVEIINRNNEEVSLDGWYLSYFSSSREVDDPFLNWDLPSLTIKESLVIGIYDYNGDWNLSTTKGEPYSSGRLSNSSGSIGLFSCDPKEKRPECIIDLVGWGDVSYVKNGESASVPKKGEILSRKGYQNDNNTDFIVEPFTSL
jgi:competence ComEA-like helix-hairpin-helix protein